MNITLGFSPCPNDTFIFDALVNKKIDVEGIEFNVMLEDVETLNKWALRGKLDITKLSYGTLPAVLNEYILLDSGSALGRGSGPLLVAKNKLELDSIADHSIAIPGENTTAHLLFSLAFPAAMKKHFVLFSSIEDLILKTQIDCGVIIHENRFTYQKKGLVKLLDLGDYWEQQTGLPIPLGGIVARRTLDEQEQKKIQTLIRSSIQYAFQNQEHLPDYVRDNAQEMNEEVMRQHINLYVNDFSLSLGNQGREAIGRLLAVYQTLHPEKFSIQAPVFLETG